MKGGQIVDDTINKFLSERKIKRIKGKLKQNTTEHEKIEIEKNAENEFLLANWLSYAIKYSDKISFVTHPAKFSHPNANISQVFAVAKKNEDGFLRTGNVDHEADVIFSTAAYMPIYTFLSLLLEDGKSILEHVEEGSDLIRKRFNFNGLPFEKIQKGLLAVKSNSDYISTDGKVKQVFFPVEQDYHLLSILTASGLMFELKKRINSIRFSKTSKSLRTLKASNEYSVEGFNEIHNLTIQGHIKSKPQCISELNKTNYGEAILLMSLPPHLNKEKVKLPRYNFFKNTLYLKPFSESFISLHKLIAVDYNNINIREARDNIIKYVVDQIVEKVWTIRSHKGGWSDTVNYLQLPAYQKIWLDSGREDDREIDGEWIVKVISDLARWFGFAYKRILGKNARLLADDELTHIRKIITQCKEGLI